MGKQITHILIVEDEEAHAELIRRAFESQADRFQITVVSSLAEARTNLAALPSDQQPDLIITDLLLPDGQGMELLPTAEDSSPFPLILMTSHGNEQIAVEAMKAGVLDYVVKSVTTLAAMPRIAERALREWGYIVERKKAEDEKNQALEQLSRQNVEIARLFEAEARRRREAETLRIAAQALSSTLDLRKVFELILSELQQVVPYDSASVQQVVGDHLKIIGGRGFSHQEKLLGITFNLTISDTPNLEVVRTRMPVILDDAPLLYEGFRHEPHAQANIHSWLGVPLLFGDRLIGMIALDKHEPKFYTQEHARLAMAFAAHAALAIENARMFDELKQTEEALRDSETRIRAIVNTAPDGIITIDEQGMIESFNPAAEKIFGYQAAEIIGGSIAMLIPLPAEELGLSPENYLDTVQATITTKSREVVGQRQDKTIFPLDLAISEMRLGGQRILTGIVRDMTERKQLEDQLRQAQKMEAVGRLAGGIAHDFNNILTVITGNCSLILDDLSFDDPLRRDIEQIKRAGERAASLTRQLLAFSRKQILQPRVINLNTVITSLESMLRPLIGEDIELHTFLESNLGQIKADPGQIEQVILNLIFNARDAMPQGGQLTIETANVHLNQEYARQHLGVDAGLYVMVAITDTGIGMDTEIKARIFEPFFTTKEQGKGTGLGLATVHGIISQSGGNIWVYSKPSEGTTFKIYLPCIDKIPEDFVPDYPLDPRIQGTETILLVEDDVMVRKLSYDALRRNGYTVLQAGHGQEALQLCRKYTGNIHLLLTDVVMPGGMNGAQLAKDLILLRPEMKVLYISGHADNSVILQGVADPSLVYLQKPFTPIGLARKVRDVLDTG